MGNLSRPMVVPRSGTLRNLFVTHGNPGSAAGQLDYTICTGPAATPTSLGVTVEANVQIGSNTSDSVVVSQGDIIRMRVEKPAALSDEPRNIQVWMSFE